MANQLKMAAVHAILTLYRLGWSQRQIAAKLGIHRATVSWYVHSPPAEAHSATNPIPGADVVAHPLCRSGMVHNCHEPARPAFFSGRLGFTSLRRADPVDD
ncbi:MAG: hypothetical protein GF393_02835 [Armatimonadia bacterium]|nr:hypothetical protein [Armatimonadia bacterium]